MNSTKENILSRSVQYLKSVGPKRSEYFGKTGIHTIRDILFYLPYKHLDRTNLVSSAKAYGYLMNGYQGELTVIATVYEKEKIRFGKKEIFKVEFRDSTGFFECVWFQGVKFFTNVFNEGDIFAISGKPALSKYNKLQFTHPDFDRISSDESESMVNTGKIIPFYTIPKELRNGNIGDFSLRRIIHQAVEEYSDYIEETLPGDILTKHNLQGLKESIQNYHYPGNKEDLEKAKHRLKFEEIFYIETLIALKKNNYKTEQQGNSFIIKNKKLISNFLKVIGFELTGAQLKVLKEIREDMSSPQPMNRLLQGDVGSGKTIVALIAMLIAIDNGFQAVLMAPTEILADQHAKNISKLMRKLNEIDNSYNVKVSLLIGGQKKSVRDKNLFEIEANEADIIIGTHALFEEKVHFKKLGLVIVDEQHRFGVVQRARLTGKGIVPDVIVMSATPIPRTLSMTIYGDLDVSVINEMPHNRKPVKTTLRGESKLPDIYKFINDKHKEGYQSFVVYPLVEESEKLDLKAAETHFNELKETYFKELNVGLIHGRMNWREKEEAMMLFLAKQFDVLISTTVIEVGIDIPDANIIVINDAHRFGLSQLHQLRGRVGRSGKQAYCILVTKDEYIARANSREIEPEFLSPGQLEKYKSSIRLQSMVKHTDGFKIAEIDMKLRGPGDIFGVKQSGFPELRYIDIINDTALIIEAKQSAFDIIKEDPHLSRRENIVIRKNLIEHYSENLKYAKIA